MIQSTEIKGAKVVYGFNPKDRNQQIQIYQVNIDGQSVLPWLEAMDSGAAVLDEISDIIRKELES